jgi:hypothetical protein
VVVAGAVVLVVEEVVVGAAVDDAVVGVAAFEPPLQPAATKAATLAKVTSGVRTTVKF